MGYKPADEPNDRVRAFLQQAFACTPEIALSIARRAVERSYPARAVILRQGDAMDPVGGGNLAPGPAFKIEHQHPGGPGDVEPPGRGIQRHIVPAAFPRHRQGAQDARGRRRRVPRRQEKP